MGRRRTFDIDEVVIRAAERFGRTGYTSTSIDDLVTEVGIVRASLYQAFGSKRGLFVAALERIGSGTTTREIDHALVIVALTDLCPVDPQIRDLTNRILDRLDLGAQRLGSILLTRAGLTDAPPAPPKETSTP